MSSDNTYILSFLDFKTQNNFYDFLIDRLEIKIIILFAYP